MTTPTRNAQSKLPLRLLLRLLWLETRHRWPAIVAILRGRTVVYNAQIGPPEEALLTIYRSGAVVMDSTFIGGPAAGVRFDA